MCWRLNQGKYLEIEWRTDFIGMQHSVIDTGEPWGVGLNETFLPHYLKEQGYATHALGKVIYVRRLWFSVIWIILGMNMNYSVFILYFFIYWNFSCSGILDITVKNIYQLAVFLIHFMDIILHSLIISTIPWYMEVRLD